MKWLSRFFSREDAAVAHPYWSRFNHAYGVASDLPALFAKMSPDPDAVVWGELWSRLCHQGASVTAASYAAFPVLVEYAESLAATQREAPLILAGAIAAHEEWANIPAEVRSEYENKIIAARELAAAALSTQQSIASFTAVLSSLAAFERHPTLGRELLAFGERIELSCPWCETDLILDCSGEEWLWVDDEPAILSLNSSSETADVRHRFAVARFEQLARMHNNETVAAWLTKLALQTSCPVCGREFILIEGIAHNSSTAA